MSSEVCDCEGKLYVRVANGLKPRTRLISLVDETHDNGARFNKTVECPEPIETKHLLVQVGRMQQAEFVPLTNSQPLDQKPAGTMLSGTDATFTCLHNQAWDLSTSVGEVENKRNSYWVETRVRPHLVQAPAPVVVPSASPKSVDKSAASPARQPWRHLPRKAAGVKAVGPSVPPADVTAVANASPFANATPVPAPATTSASAAAPVSTTSATAPVFASCRQGDRA